MIGLHYTRVNWHANGGSFIYTPWLYDEEIDDYYPDVDNFRNDRGNFDPNEKGISYQMTYLSPYVGLNTQYQKGNFTLSSGAKLGVTLQSDAKDFHHLRSMTFWDELEPSMYTAFNLGVEQKINASSSWTASIERQVYARALGDETALGPETGGALEFYEDIAGGALTTTSLNIGYNLVF